MNITNPLLTWIACGAVVMSAPVFAGDGLTSLRGDTPIEQSSPAPEISSWKQDDVAVERNFAEQPPLIPHHIKAYKIDLRSNKCLTCHNRAMAQKTGAPEIGPTHFRDRDGNETPGVSPRRYFCLQCHVPQKAVLPLVDNTFRQADAENQTQRQGSQ
ncbi:MAG: cytochrome c-type protein NapB [Gammaproteobacteria bacterium]|nr:MAG: cytochrome c-type protein NapB [Gammaproteobacteria bacterium]TND02618.1 MAG: cytochrome c-type protein NapB [Gammaproteobacteria bacterium]